MATTPSTGATEPRTGKRVKQPESAETDPASPAAGQSREQPDRTPPNSELEKTDDPRPGDALREMKRQRALADANKPIEAAVEAIWSTDPDKVKAREAVQEAYRKAARTGTTLESEGELRTRYNRANEKFVEAAHDLLRRRPDRTDDRLGSRLTTWIATYLPPADQASDKAVVRSVLRQRKQVADRLNKLLGEREKARQVALDETKRWEKAFGRWSAPDKEMGAMIASYADRIDQLNADINTGNNRDQAIFSFWFEVAPVHLQLRPDKVDESDTPGVDLIKAALKESFPDLMDNFKSGRDRKDGSLFLIDPDNLANKRKQVLERWQEAAIEQAEAEAEYATRPDAAADLKPRHDKLKDDGWVKGTKEALATPKP